MGVASLISQPSELNWGRIPIRGKAVGLANNDSPIWALTPIQRIVPLETKD